MSPHLEARREARIQHRRIIEEACKTIASPVWHKRNEAITKIFNLLANEPLLCQYHRSQISGLLAKYGDDADIEVADYAMESIDYAQDIIAEENLIDGTNAHRAIEDLIIDARDILQRRCPEIRLPEDIMASVWTQPRTNAHGDFEENDDDEEEDMGDYEEEEDDEEDEEDGMEDYEDGVDPKTDSGPNGGPPTPTSTSLMHLDGPPSPAALQTRILARTGLALPANYELAAGSAIPTSQFEDFAFEVEQQHLGIVGIVMMLLLANPPALQANVLAYATAQGFHDDDLRDMVQRAYVPRRRVGGVLESDVVVRSGRPGD